MRLRSNLCLWSKSPVYSGKGRPRVHGNKFKLNEPGTWIEPVQILEINDSNLGWLRIRLWDDLHFRSAAQHPMSRILVKRLKSDGSIRVATIRFG